MHNCNTIPMYSRRTHTYGASRCRNLSNRKYFNLNEHLITISLMPLDFMPEHYRKETTTATTITTRTLEYRWPVAHSNIKTQLHRSTGCQKNADQTFISMCVWKKLCKIQKYHHHSAKYEVCADAPCNACIDALLYHNLVHWRLCLQSQLVCILYIFCTFFYLPLH